MSQLVPITENQMPMTWRQAKSALAVCATTDECKEWKDKALALAAYAKQANDDALLTLANRIKAQAVVRAGELFNQVDSKQGARTDLTSEGRISEVTRRDAAADAGWSQDQRKQAQRIANLPREEVEALIESDTPPTLSELDRIARNNPEAMRATTSLLGEMKRFASFCNKHPAASLVSALASHEKAALMAHAHIVVEWLSDLAKEIDQ